MKKEGLTPEQINNVNEARERVEGLRETDNKYQDSVHSLATFEDDVRKEMIEAGLTKEQVEKFANDMSTVKLESVEFEKKSLIDNLTGLLRKSEEIGQTLVDMEIRGGHNCSILMIDFDHFKRINDTYGHSVGDQALKGMASVLKESIRGSDIAFRYGGEEFLIFLPNTDLETAGEVAEKIRNNVSKDPVIAQGEGDKCVTFKATISIGCADMQQVDGFSEKPAKEVFLSMVDKADKALLKSKEFGRNKVTLFSLAEKEK